MIYDNILNIYTNTPIAQIPENQIGVRYIELTAEQIERYNNWVSNIGGQINNNWVLTGEGVDYDQLAKETALRALKASKMTTLNANYQSKLAEGYTYNNWLFDLDENTKQNIGDWTSFLVLNPNLDNFLITDKNKVQRSMDKTQFTEFGVGFGSALSNLKGLYAFKRNSIENSTTEAEVNAVDIENFNL